MRWDDLSQHRRNLLKMAYQDGVSLTTLSRQEGLPLEMLRDSLDYLNYARRRSRGEPSPPLKPMGDRILVWAPINSLSSILDVKPQHSKPEPQEGTVLEVGPDVHQVAVGDIVLFRFSVAGRDLRIAGRPCVLMPEEDVFCVVEREDAA